MWKEHARNWLMKDRRCTHPYVMVVNTNLKCICVFNIGVVSLRLQVMHVRIACY